MNKILKIALIALVVILGSVSALSTLKSIKLSEKLASLEQSTSPEGLSKHQREVWAYVLEWCESSGIMTAVNPKDKDNTPSFGSYQFKPATFSGYAKKYGVSGVLMEWAAQHAMVLRMMDDPDVKWENEFPDCIRKIGFPPKAF